MADLVFKVDAKSETPTRVSANARQFSIVVDEPPTLGGEDVGANPVEYLLASYAGCLNVMAHLVARELNLKLNKLRIQVSGNLNPDKLFGKPSEDRAGFKHIEVQIFPETDAPEELVNQWLEEVESRCPVNDNLSNHTPISIQIVR